MSYLLTYDGGTLFDPVTDDAVYDARLTAKVNNPDYLDFTVPPGHALYDAIRERGGPVRLEWDGETLFAGEVESVEADTYGAKAVSCAGALAWLKDTVVRPYSTVAGEQPLTAPSGVDGLFAWYVSQHNAHVIDSRKTFAVGDNQGAALDANNHVYRSSEQAATTWDEIGDKVLDSLGGYVTVDYDPLTVNLYADVHDSNAQVIDFGENVTCITVKTDSTSQYTALRPTGATPKGADGPLTVAGLPDGGTSDPGISKLGDVVYSPEAASEWGYRECAWSNQDCETADGLLESAVSRLRAIMAPTVTVTVKAVDLALVSDRYDHLRVGQAVRVRSRPHGLDEWLMVSSADIDLQDPSQTEYTLGDERSTLTGQQSGYLRSMNGAINSALDSVGSLGEDVRESAKVAQEAADKASDAAEMASSAVTGVGEEYATAPSREQVPTVGWSPVRPEETADVVVWRRTVTTNGDGTVSHGEAVPLTGPQGEKGDTGKTGPQGPQGATGPQGEKGADGKSPTVSVSKDAGTTTITVANADGTTTTTKVLDGAAGTPGTPGADGRTPHLHVKYSDDGGKTFTANGGETPGQWLGTLTDFTRADPTSPGEYSWARIKGDTGKTGPQGPQGATGPQGEKGADGKTGRGLKSSVPEYYLSTSSTACSGGSWVKAPPKYVSGCYYWTRAAQTWENPSGTTYTAPVYDPSLTEALSGVSDLKTLIREDATYGVEVGKSRDGKTFSGVHTTQGASKFAIHAPDHTELASFSANKIELGNGSKVASIDMLDGTLAVSTAKSKLEDGSDFTYCNLSSGSADAISVSEDVSGADKAAHSRLQLGIMDAPLTTAKRNQPLVSCETLYNDKSGNAANVHTSGLEMSSTPGQALAQMSAFDGNQAGGKGLKARLGVSERGGTSFVGISGDKISVTTSSGISSYPMANLKNALDNGAYVNVPWTVSDAANEVEWCVRGGIVFVHIGGYATPNGKVVTGPPLGYYSRHGGYFPCFYYTSNNVMGAWVPPRKDNSRGIYVYGLGGAVGCLLSLNMSWPLYD